MPFPIVELGFTVLAKVIPLRDKDSPRYNEPFKRTKEMVQKEKSPFVCDSLCYASHASMHMTKTDYLFREVVDNSKAGGSPPYAVTKSFVGKQAQSIQQPLTVTDDLVLHPFLFPGAVHPFYMPTVLKKPSDDARPPPEETQWGRALWIWAVQPVNHTVWGAVGVTGAEGYELVEGANAAMQKLRGRMAWLHVLLPVTNPDVGKLYGVKSATPGQKGFVMWLPCTIKEIEFDKHLGSLLVHLHKFSWGNQVGLPFKTGASDNDQTIPDAEWIVRFPEEDGALWLEDFKSPACWAAANALCYQKLRRNYPGKPSSPTPAVFAVYAPDDSDRVGHHSKWLEAKWLESS
eukprot:3635484-Rhodomonas_salina.1